MSDGFELYLWGPRVHRVERAFAKKLPLGVSVRVGSLGAALTFPLSLTDATFKAVVERFERYRREGGFFFGVLPEQVASARDLHDAWTSARRTSSVVSGQPASAFTVDTELTAAFEVLFEVLISV